MRWKIAAVSRFPTSGAARLVSVLLIVRMHSTGPEAIAEYRERAHPRQRCRSTPISRCADPDKLLARSR